MSRPALVLMARTPVPGQAKTRLEAETGADTAAAVAAVLIRGTARLARQAWRGPVELHAWPDSGHPVLREVAREHGLALRTQAPGHLGAKMHAALEHGIRAAGACAVMGCDVPHCPPAALTRACELLAAGQPVAGPAADGGFWLLGLTRVDPSLVREESEWGSGPVLERLLARAAAAGVVLDTTLPRLRDIDTWPDLVEAARTWPPLRRFLRCAHEGGPS